MGVPDEHGHAHVLTALVHSRPGVLNDGALHATQRLGTLSPLWLGHVTLRLHAAHAPRWGRGAEERLRGGRRGADEWCWGRRGAAEGAAEAQGERAESVEPPSSQPSPLATPSGRQGALGLSHTTTHSHSYTCTHAVPRFPC